MKKQVFMIFGLVMVSLLFFCTSQTIAAEKTGIVDIREIMMKSDAGKQASTEMTKIVEKSRAKIQPVETELKKLKDELEKQRSILTDVAMKEKETTYQKKFRDYQLLVKDSNEELQVKEQEISKKLLPEILKVIRAIGEREKYTVILDIATGPIAYYTKEIDMSARVIEEFNKSYKPSK